MGVFRGVNSITAFIFNINNGIKNEEVNFGRVSAMFEVLVPNGPKGNPESRKKIPVNFWVHRTEEL